MIAGGEKKNKIYMVSNKGLGSNSPATFGGLSAAFILRGRLLE